MIDRRAFLAGLGVAAGAAVVAEKVPGVVDEPVSAELEASMRREVNLQVDLVALGLNRTPVLRSGFHEAGNRAMAIVADRLLG